MRGGRGEKERLCWSECRPTPPPLFSTVGPVRGGGWGFKSESSGFDRQSAKRTLSFPSGGGWGFLANSLRKRRTGAEREEDGGNAVNAEGRSEGLCWSYLLRWVGQVVGKTSVGASQFRLILLILATNAPKESTSAFRPRGRRRSSLFFRPPPPRC